MSYSSCIYSEKLLVIYFELFLVYIYKSELKNEHYSGELL